MVMMSCIAAAYLFIGAFYMFRVLYIFRNLCEKGDIPTEHIPDLYYLLTELTQNGALEGIFLLGMCLWPWVIYTSSAPSSKPDSRPHDAGC